MKELLLTYAIVVAVGIAVMAVLLAGDELFRWLVGWPIILILE